MFDPAVFAARRDAFMQALGPGAVAVVRSLPERLRNGDAFHPFRQHSDVLYLTGFVEPDTTLVLTAPTPPIPPPSCPRACGT
jgi:Xaa-Pro aminopeptidase